MRQSYHSYRRRVRRIRIAHWRTFMNAMYAAGGFNGYESDAVLEVLDARALRMTQEARRQFEQRRQRGGVR